MAGVIAVGKWNAYMINSTTHHFRYDYDHPFGMTAQKRGMYSPCCTPLELQGHSIPLYMPLIRK